MSMFIRDVGFWFSFHAMSLSGLGIRLMLAQRMS